ncbi:hypothetical protein [Rhodopirellula baltica]|uniref:Uncharacterized protein n=1 Tax=Rhodopirellula baltica SWK14 TaxID=993516 RepID=L7CAF6_RHOBT|nr:hypothetical protein [Rhodopirellula baltica]ELP30091.1 hypothetical protein RBSWK_05977 [Rhodopirellula baltica SWK14]
MFEVTDYHELLALNKSLFEARYHAAPDHREIPGSPFVAAMHERVLAAIFAHDNLPQPKIDEFLKWSNRTGEQDAVRHHLKDADWCRMDSDTQRQYVTILVQPFIATEAEIDALIEFAQNHHNG